jgi:hypothetical protein
MRTFRAFVTLLCSPFLALSVWAADPVLYDNFGTDLHKFLDETNAEAGDQITIAPALPTQVQTFTFEYFLKPTLATGNETVEIRFYKLDGGALAPDDPTPTPGTVFYDSGALPITQTGQARMSISPGVNLPPTFAWTAQFQGGNIAQGQVAGLELYDPPTVGSDTYEFWERTGNQWSLYYYDQYPANFGAQIIPVPEPGTTVLLLMGAAGLAGWRLLPRRLAPRGC